MTSTETPRGRHRLAASPRPVRRPSLMPRSATMIVATVGAVLGLGVDHRVELPAPRPHQDVPAPALEPVVPVQRDGRPARFDPVPAGVTGRSIAGAHTAGSASVSALDAVAATQPPRAISPAHLFAT